MASTPASLRDNVVLLRTKLAVPPLQPRLVPGPDLVGVLEQGGSRKLTLISAPAGFGKTTLVCQWIAACRPRVAWYSLDTSDNEPSVFYRYLLTSLQGLDPTLKSAFDPLLQGHSAVGRDVITHVNNHLSNLRGDVHLVLDDFQAITSAQLHDDILRLLKSSPPQFHVTLITRQDPPLQLSRLRVSGEVTELRITDLQFTLDDAVRFFHDTMQLDLPVDRVEELRALTEGWIVGLQVAGLSLQKGGDPKRLTAKAVLQNRDMLDYLFEEVLQGQAAEVQDFLLRTSLLRQFSGALCAHMTGVRDASGMLQELERRNLFIVPLDDSRRWYRFHPLFAQMLRRRLETSAGYSVTDLHRAAASWYGEHGYVEEAFQHAFSSGDYEFAADLVEQKCLSLIDNYEWAAARRWLEGLPQDVLERRFLLRLYRALVVFLQEELTNIDSTVADLEGSFAEMTRSYTAEKRKLAEDVLLALKMNCLHYYGPATVIPASRRALETISPRNLVALGLVQAVLSTAYIEQGDLQPAMEVVRTGLDTLAHASPVTSNYVRAYLLNKQARLEFLFGRLRAAEGLLGDALAYAREQDPPLRSAMAMFNLTSAQIFYSRNELDAALEHATRCVEYAEPVSDIGYLLLGLRLQAFVHESHGESEVARAIMDEALRVARQTKSSVRIASTELSAVQLAAMRSELDTVARWASRRHLDLAEPFSRNFEKECLLLARFDMASHRYQSAVDLLAALRPRVADRRRLTSLLALDVLMASCLAQLDREEEAADLLASCIEFAGPEGYVRPFVESAAYLVDMLFSLCSSHRGVARVHAAKLLKACEVALSAAPMARPPAGGGTSGTLSAREVQVLRLLYSGMTNKEIASQAFISPNTVKTHIKKIYGKLGVTTRDEAIMRAKELNYL